MSRYFLKQTFWSIVKLFLFLTFMFFFIQVMMPGDFVDQFALGCDAQCRQEMRAQLGLDLPMWKRYLHWLNQIIQLDFGKSMNGLLINEIFKKVIPPTLLVFFFGTLISFGIGVWLGKNTAWQEKTIVSRLTTLGGLTLFTSFPPWLAFLVTYLFTNGSDFMVMGERGGLGTPNFRGLDRLLWASVDISPSQVVMDIFLVVLFCGILFFLIKQTLEILFQADLPLLLFMGLALLASVGIFYLIELEMLALDIMKKAYLPMITYILLSFGETMLIMQTSMREVKNEEYIFTARAKGLPERKVRERHAVRNAILPALSRLVISLPYLLTGVVIIESSVGWPGMGTNMWNALYWQNMPIVMDTMLIVGVISLIARLLLDIITAYLDPRIRHQEVKIKMS
jgi:peptide/nickel transport system permease protein